GFQRAEYLLEHGMVDMVVHRHNLRSTIGSLVALLTGAASPAELREAPERIAVTPLANDDDLDAPVAQAASE
ncbi:MAG: acetyl-CoA carboxylase carboxyl transferase subunit beta, partial [Devosia sp.]